MDPSKSRFRVLRPLGAGGMGTVELVEDGDGRKLARKRTRLLPGDADGRLAFRREFHTLATLRHPAIVEAMEFGVDGDESWYTMEYLPGKDLYALGKVPWSKACSILRDVASALALLHSRRLIHRDIKPGNIKLDEQGRARLIDFGIMTSFGSSPDIAGTPGYMPPESAAGLPLDQGVDLYALGGLGYWLLTGQNAMSASNLAELTRAWAQPLRPPSALVPELPPGLDELILGLLAQDPLARPASAAEVIERLSALAKLDKVETHHPATWSLSSTVLAGRTKEVELIDRVIGAWGVGEVGTVLLTGPSGMGKSRLLREAVLRSQIAGATPIEVRCSIELGDTRPYAALAQFAAGLLRRHREATLAAAAPVAADLGLVLPELAAAIGCSQSTVARLDPAEARLRAIDALRSWLGALGETLRPVAIVDDLQWCDEGSAALFASLAREGDRPPLLMFAALRTDVPALAQGAVRALREAGRTQRLRPLSQGEIHTLVAGIFGEAEHLESTVQWCHRVSGGSPMLCIDLAQHLIESNLARSEGGLWILPAKPDAAEFPSGLAAASDARVTRLSTEAQQVGRALAILGRSAPAATVHRLVDLSYDQLFVALDELVARDVISQDQHELRLTHDAIREGLLRSLDDRGRQALHLRAATALQPEGPVPPELAAPLGWHWLRGGQERRGADLLAQAGLRYVAEQAAPEAIPLLKAALEVYERLGVERATQFLLRHKLVLAGLVCDWPVLMAQGPPTLTLAWDLAGFRFAQALAKVVGRPLALVSGMAWAWVRWLCTPRAFRVATPAQAMEVAFVTLFALAADAAHHEDIQAAARVSQRLILLEGFKVGVPFALARIAQSILHMATWHPDKVVSASLEARRALRWDRWSPLGELERRALLGATYNTPLFVAAYQLDPVLFEGLASAERFGLRAFDVSHAVLAVIYHQGRGDARLGQAALARFERDQTALGRAWMWDSVMSQSALMTCAWNRDVLGLRRALARYEIYLRTHGLPLDNHAILGRGEYLRERGDLAESRRVLETAGLEEEGDGYVTTGIPVAYAETLLGLGELDEAEQQARRAYRLACRPRREFLPNQVRSLRALALIAATQGRLDQAREEIRRARTLAQRSGAPTLVGSLYEAEAQIAHDAGDQLGFRLACEQLREVYARTENPILIARAEQVAALARDHGSEEGVGAADNVITLALRRSPEDLLRDRTAGARSITARCCAALDATLELTDARAGYVFVVRGGAFELVAPEHGAEPPPEVEETLVGDLNASPEPGRPLPTGRFVNDGWWVATLGDPTTLALALHEPNYDPAVMESLLRVLTEVTTTGTARSEMAEAL